MECEKENSSTVNRPRWNFIFVCDLITDETQMKLWWLYFILFTDTIIIAYDWYIYIIHVYNVYGCELWPLVNVVATESVHKTQQQY